MKLALIAAMSRNGVIGQENRLPWHLPEDLKYFKATTVGKPVIMGRKTFESMGNKPLAERQNIILTRSIDFNPPNCLIVRSIEEALRVVDHSEEVMVIGGGKVYEIFLPWAYRLYLTIVEQKVIGDVYFPKIEWSEWLLVSEQKKTGFVLQVFDRISGGNHD